MIMATYTYEQIGSTLRHDLDKLAELVAGSTLDELLKSDKIDVHEKTEDTIRFYYGTGGKISAVIRDADLSYPYLDKDCLVWNNATDDWDWVSIKENVYLKKAKEQKPKQPIQIVVVDTIHESVEIIFTTAHTDSFACDKFLREKGYNLDDIYWMWSTHLQLSHKTL